MAIQPDQSPTGEAFARRERLLEDFEQGWSTGTPPEIDAFVAQALPQDRAAVLHDLVLIDLERRRKRGEAVSVESYLQRYPTIGGNAERLAELRAAEQAWRPAAGADVSSQATGPFHDTDRPSNDPIPLARANWPQIPDFEIESELGKGGMGVVYKARQVSVKRWVALKMIRFAAGAGRDAVQRFQREAETVALLDHPHIVPLYSFGDYQGQPYFCLKLMEGGSLNQRLDQYQSQPRAIAELMLTVAEALHHAHQRSVLHRDLKPHNILLDADGQPHITDFGLAKRLESADAELSASGYPLGTPSYMAPEQVAYAKGAITVATDVYGLGAICYALLTGQPPFSGANLFDILDRVKTKEPVAPSALNPGIDRDLEIICLKCLEKDPARRYATAEALADDLRRFQTGRPILARRVTTIERGWKLVKRRPTAAALVAVVAVALVTVGAILIRDQIHRESLQRDISEALTSGERAHKDFEEILVDRRVLELQNNIEDWQTRVRQARADWVRADTLARANSELVEPILVGRITTLGENLHLDETGLDLAKEIIQSQWIKNNPPAPAGWVPILNTPSFPRALGMAFCDRGAPLLFRQENPKLALQSFERAIRILQGSGDSMNGRKMEEVHGIIEQAKTGRDTASLLLQGFTGTLSHLPVTTYQGSLAHKLEEVTHGSAHVSEWRETSPTPGTIQGTLVRYRWTLPPGVHEVPMLNGWVYLIEVESRQFDASLHLRDSSGQVLAGEKSTPSTPAHNSYSHQKKTGVTEPQSILHHLMLGWRGMH